jgi:hypothetical protein
MKLSNKLLPIFIPYLIPYPAFIPYFSLSGKSLNLGMKYENWGAVRK